MLAFPRLAFLLLSSVVALSALGSREASAVYLCNPDNVSDPDIAISACNKEIAAGRNLAIAYYDRGLAYAKKKETDKALADYNRSLKINPKYQNALISRGNALKIMGQPERAIEDYNTAISINPAAAGLAFYNRGNSWRDKDEGDKAVADYSMAIDLMPSYANAYVARGNIWKGKRDFDKAMIDYDTAIRISPDGADLAYYNRGVTWRLKKEPEKAIADYSKYISMKPADPDGYIARGNIYSDKNDYAAAIAEYDRALAIDSSNDLAVKNRANAVEKRKAAEEAASSTKPNADDAAAK